MILLKNSEQIAGMRAAGQVLAEVRRRASTAIRPGVTTGELNAIVEQVFRERNAEPVLKGFPGVRPFPAAACVCVNEEAVHGVPGTRQLQRGDLVTIDTACRLDGWCSDLAWTAPVGEVQSADELLLATGQAAVDQAIEILSTVCSWQEVAGRVVREVQKRGFSVVPDLAGHGLGRELHEDPRIGWERTEDTSSQEVSLDHGLAFTIEPLITGGIPRVRPAGDGWTLVMVDGARSVHFEHTVVLTPAGVDVLTASDCPACSAC